MTQAARLGGVRTVGVLAILAVVAMLCLLTPGPAQAQAQQAQAATYTPIVGQGSTYAYPALNQWATNLESQGVSISYTPNGSAAGRQAYIENTVDFAGSDIAFLTSADPDPFNGVDVGDINFAYSYIPDVAGGLSFLYNLQVGGHQIRNMRLSGLTLEKIFTGQITNWDNPEITAEYGAPLPPTPITVVTRSDGAGESYFLTNWFLNGLGPQGRSMWISYCRAQGGNYQACATNPTELYQGLPTFKRLDGSADVTAYIDSPDNNGAIGYAEYAYAIPDNIPVVSLENAAGYYQQPTAANVAVSLNSADINEDPSSVDFLMQDLTPVYLDKDPRTYPLSSYSYLIVPRTSRTIDGTTYSSQPFSDSKGATLSKYVGYILCGAQQTAAALGYSPLPKPMVQGGFTQYNYIPGHLPPPQGNNYNSCDNPAYHDGVDTILTDAPYPNACQKVGSPLNCNPNAPNNGGTTGNGNGKGKDKGKGKGNSKDKGNSADNGNGTGNGNGNGNGGSTGNNVNPNTGQPSGSTSSANPDAVAQPVALAGQPTGQWLFGVLTALELLAVVVVPVALGTWLQRRRRGGGGGGGGGGGPRPLGHAGQGEGQR
jgi:ABC-type phosphate transport system substrate-binding protein